MNWIKNSFALRIPAAIALLLLSACRHASGVETKNTELATKEAAEARTNQERNLLVNGGFELGLGAEPFYPGWCPRSIRNGGAGGHGITPTAAETPPRPFADETVARSGGRSLDLEGIGLRAFDWCGEPFELPSKQETEFRPDAIYLQSASPRLLERLQAASVEWVN